MSKTPPVIAISGGFDPLHSGHLRMLQDTMGYGDVLVILNSDEWLIRKKGYVFMPRTERHALLMAIKGVTQVVSVDDSDGTVIKALIQHKPMYFGNGGDRGTSNTPEQDVCAELDIKCIFGLGGGKTQSSSSLVDNIVQKTRKEIYLDVLKHLSWGGRAADWVRDQLGKLEEKNV